MGRKMMISVFFTSFGCTSMNECNDTSHNPNDNHDEDFHLQKSIGKHTSSAENDTVASFKALRCNPPQNLGSYYQNSIRSTNDTHESNIKTDTSRSSLIVESVRKKLDCGCASLLGEAASSLGKICDTVADSVRYDGGLGDLSSIPQRVLDILKSKSLYQSEIMDVSIQGSKKKKRPRKSEIHRTGECESSQNEQNLITSPSNPKKARHGCPS